MAGLFFSPRRNIPKDGAGKIQRTVYFLCAFSLLSFVLVSVVPFKQGEKIKKEMIRAAEIMEEALAAFRECRGEKGVAIDKENDFNETGLIGVKFSPTTTSLGSLEAKRTANNPNFAALIVYLLNRAGVRKGNIVAAGASGSFPSLIVAALSASKAMGLKLLLISSLGASQWGANNPDFHWLDMQSCLQEAGLFDAQPVAISLGGEKDTGMDMSPEGRAILLQEAEEWRGLFLEEPDLSLNVQQRMVLYEKYAGEEGIKAFINIGGSWSNLGTDSEILKLKPGLVRLRYTPPAEKRGVMQEMALRGIPVIHLLHIKGLSRRYRLPWDPKPLPHPGEGRLFPHASETQPSFFCIAGGYFILLILVVVFRKKIS
jgi:poly-gamma-glutamate system protein